MHTARVTPGRTNERTDDGRAHRFHACDDDDAPRRDDDDDETGGGTSDEDEHEDAEVWCKNCN